MGKPKNPRLDARRKIALESSRGPLTQAMLVVIAVPYGVSPLCGVDTGCQSRTCRWVNHLDVSCALLCVFGSLNHKASVEAQPVYSNKLCCNGSAQHCPLGSGNARTTGQCTWEGTPRKVHLRESTPRKVHPRRYTQSEWVVIAVHIWGSLHYVASIPYASNAWLR